LHFILNKNTVLCYKSSRSNSTKNSHTKDFS